MFTVVAVARVAFVSLNFLLRSIPSLNLERIYMTAGMWRRVRCCSGSVVELTDSKNKISLLRFLTFDFVR